MNHIKEDYLERMTPIHRNDEGQSLVEFVLVIAFALGITFLFVSQTFNVTRGYLLHYVNYMGSRIYLVKDRGSITVAQNYQEAEGTVRSYWQEFDLAGQFNINAECEFHNYLSGNGLFTGTTCAIEESISLFPIIGGGDKAKLVTESFLGKEPVRANCYQMTCQAIAGSRGACRGLIQTSDITVYDNGC